MGSIYLHLHTLPPFTMTTFGGDDEDQTTPLQPDPEDTGGPEAGNYTPPEDLPIPGESEGMDNSQLG